MKVKLLPLVLSSIIINSPLYAVEITSPAPKISTATTVSPLININTADVQMLTKSIKGIGAKRAEAIVQYREKNDKFKSLNDLALVPGLGKKFVKNNYELLQKTFTVN